MHVVETVEALEALRQTYQKERVAFVPTMGALHDGHLTLLDKARELADRVVVSIYVNPLQFGFNEDYTRYPRTREADLALCEARGVDVVFCPTESVLYPTGLELVTRVHPPRHLTEQLCGLNRPGHFAGVATVVLKLFNLVKPDIAVFGQKDAQQLKVIEQMVADLNLSVKIIPAPTARDSDGLALSSRNTYLVGADERRQARLLSRLLMQLQALYQQGMTDWLEMKILATEHVLDEDLYPDFTLEYLEAVNASRFSPVLTLDDQSRLVVAARVGSVRLIDNVLVSQPLMDGSETIIIPQSKALTSV